jgi:hypothetical protein
MSGQHLKLEGIGAFDAAVHCASVAAAERQHKIKSTGGGSNPSAGGNNAASSSRGPSTSLGELQDGAGANALEHAATAPTPTDDASSSAATAGPWPCPPSSTVPMHTESTSDADAPSPFMHGPPMWPYTPSGSETLAPHMEEHLMLQHLAQHQLQLPVPLMHQQHQQMQLQQQMPCMPQDSYTESILQQDSLAPGTPGPHDHPFISTSSFMAGPHSQPSSVPSMAMPSVISGLGSAVFRDLPLSDSTELLEEETAVHPQRRGTPVYHVAWDPGKVWRLSLPPARTHILCSILTIASTCVPCLPASPGFSSDESSPRNTVNIRANSGRRACRSPSRVSHVPGPDSLCGDEAIEGEHSFSGRLKTGVRTLAKKLASSLGRMVRHPDDHVFTFPDGQSSSSFVCGPLAPAAPQAQF